MTTAQIVIAGVFTLSCVINVALWAHLLFWCVEDKNRPWAVVAAYMVTINALLAAQFASVTVQP